MSLQRVVSKMNPQTILRFFIRQMSSLELYSDAFGLIRYNGINWCGRASEMDGALGWRETTNTFENSNQ
jgi:hypothetical protein